MPTPSCFSSTTPTAGRPLAAPRSGSTTRLKQHGTLLLLLLLLLHAACENRTASRNVACTRQPLSAPQHPPLAPPSAKLTCLLSTLKATLSTSLVAHKAAGGAALGGAAEKPGRQQHDVRHTTMLPTFIDQASTFTPAKIRQLMEDKLQCPRPTMPVCKCMYLPCPGLQSCA